MRNSTRSSRLRTSGLPRLADRHATRAQDGPRAGLLPARVAPEDRPVWTGPCPDLLHPEPEMSVDALALLPQLAFAFAGGEATERLRALLADVAAPDSAWTPSAFAGHLHLDAWVTHLASRPARGRPLDADPASLRRILGHPPRAPKVRAFRQAILTELAASSEAEAQLHELRTSLRALREHFLRPPVDASGDGPAHRLATLRTLRGLIGRLADSFEGATSGLARLRDLARAHRDTEAYRRLVDLLEHDRRRATVRVDLRIGGDGRVRELTIAAIHEDTRGRFYQTPAQRWWTRVKLVWRGYRFSEAEVIERWIDQVYAEHAELVPGFLQLIGHVEWYLAALAFRDEAQRRGLAVSLPEFVETDAGYTGLWNPLLLAQDTTPVPCSIARRAPGSTTIVTGPNSGGKTRLMQSLGLAQLLAEGGFFVPAAEARVRATPYLFCSLVQDDRPEQTEGRLGSELIRIRQLFERAPPGSLVMIDELCSGTNPSEGEEIFMLVLDLLGELGPETIVTTHFLDFAHRLAQDADRPALGFLRVELGPDDAPTFQFVPGVATTSLAGRAAARLGVTREELRALVRRHRNSDG